MAKSKDYAAVPPDIVAAARPLREMRRPTACNNGRVCWVRDGAAAFPRHLPTGLPKCLGCGGVPRP